MKTMIYHSNRTNKYGNRKVRTLFKGEKVVFDSKAESARAIFLTTKEREGKIENLRRQVKYRLMEFPYFKNNVVKKTKKDYIADFVYIEDGIEVIEDVKSPATANIDLYKMKRDLLINSLDRKQIFREVINGIIYDYRRIIL